MNTHETHTRYQLRVEGHLAPDWANQAATLHLPDGTTQITSRFLDQAELVGFLRYLTGMGITLIELSRLEGESRMAEDNSAHCDHRKIKCNYSG